MDNKLMPMNNGEAMFSRFSVVKYKDKFVLTTEQLAKVYETTVDDIEENFAKYKKRFVEGLHYHLLKDEELNKFRNKVENFDLVDKNASQFYLWSVRGATRYSKILDTAVAWRVLDKLCESEIQ